MAISLRFRTMTMPRKVSVVHRGADPLPRAHHHGSDGKVCAALFQKAWKTVMKRIARGVFPDRRFEAVHALLRYRRLHPVYIPRQMVRIWVAPSQSKRQSERKTMAERMESGAFQGRRFEAVHAPFRYRPLHSVWRPRQMVRISAAPSQFKYQRRKMTVSPIVISTMLRTAFPHLLPPDTPMVFLNPSHQVPVPR